MTRCEEEPRSKELRAVLLPLSFKTFTPELSTSSIFVNEQGSKNMSKLSKSAACGDIKRHLRSQGADAMIQDQDGDGEPDRQQGQGVALAHDISNIYTALTKISEDLEGLAEIRRSTASVENKLSSLITRMDDVEKRMEYLETAEKEWQANPPASKTEVRQIWEKLEDMENRSRRNNVRFVGFPEGKEGGDVVKFLEELMPNLVDMEGRREIERAHRVASQRPAPGDRPRPILAKFLRSSDRDAVLRAARNKGKLTWGNTTIMLFPDYSRATQMKRDKFKECKKKLHEQGVSFRMLYPAKLRIETSEGERAFDCPRKAMTFIDAMQ